MGPNLRTCLGGKNARVDALAVKAEDPKAIRHVEFVPSLFSSLSMVCVRTEGYRCLRERRFSDRGD